MLLTPGVVARLVVVGLLAVLAGLVPEYVGTHDGVYLDGVFFRLGGEPPTAK